MIQSQEAQLFSRGVSIMIKSHFLNKAVEVTLFGGSIIIKNWGLYLIVIFAVLIKWAV